MKNLTTIAIIIALGFGYMQNKTQINSFLGLSASTSEVSDQTTQVDGIRYIKLNSTADLSEGVHLISASWCGYCAKLRKLLTQHNIPFKEYNAEADNKVNAFIDANNLGNGVPITVVFGDIVYGYDVEQLEQTFKKHGLAIKGL